MKAHRRVAPARPAEPCEVPVPEPGPGAHDQAAWESAIVLPSG